MQNCHSNPKWQSKLLLVGHCLGKCMGSDFRDSQLLQINTKASAFSNIKMRMSRLPQILFTFLACAIMTGMLVASFILKSDWHVFNLGFGFLGVYGLILMGFLLIQQGVSLLNNHSWIPKLIRHSTRSPVVGIQVVGYREDLQLFRRCLISLAS